MQVSTRTMTQPLPQSFYARSAEEVAADLLGAVLVHATPEGAAAGRVVETEAYLPDDPACHAFGGRTRRNSIMFGEPGRAYTYFSYGCHWLFNVVTGDVGVPSAVLVRALEPVAGLEAMRERRGTRRATALTSGPGKLSQALAIDGSHYGQPVWEGDLTIRAGETGPIRVETSGRIGLSKATEAPLRFYVADSEHLSRRRVPKGDRHVRSSS